MTCLTTRPLALISLACTLLFSSACANQKQTTSLPASSLVKVEGMKNCYRYNVGDGSVNEIDLTSDLSKKGDGFVVFVATNPGNEAKAVAHAKKISKWFETRVDTISTVPVVIYPNNKGVGYTFMIFGERYWHAEHAPQMFMQPKQTVAALEDAVLTYKARKEMKRRGML